MISSAEEFLALMRSDDPEDYHRFRNDSAPLNVWEELITKYSLANEWVALNKTSPVEILARLADDPRVLVRAQVASVRRITEDTQEKLAHDSDASVRNSLANNAKAARRILELLAEDPQEFVRNSARKRLSERFGVEP